MSYLNTLVKNIETVKYLNRDMQNIYSGASKELTYNDVEKLKDDSNKQVVEALGLLSMSTSLIEMRYVLSSDKLKEKILGLDEDGVNIFERILRQTGITEIMSAETLSLYDVSALKELFDYSDEKEYYLGAGVSSVMFKYLQEKKIHDDAKVFIKVLDILHDYIRQSVDMDDNVDVCEKLEYAIDNSLEKMEYNSIKEIMSNAFPGIDMSYLSYISNHGIKSVYGTNVKDVFLKSLIVNNDFLKRKELLSEIEGVLIQDFSKVLKVFETEGFSNKEINTYLYKLKNGESMDFEDIGKYDLYKALLSFIYPNFNSEYKYKNEELAMCHYALSSGKKKFLSAYGEFKESQVAGMTELSLECVYKLLNLNSLTASDIKDIESRNLTTLTKRLNSYCERGFKNISAKEFMYIISLSINHSMVYKRLLDMRVDDRMRIVSDLPKIDEKLSSDDADKIAALLKQKSLSKRIEEEYKKLQRCSKKGIGKDVWLKYFLINDLDSMKKQVETDLDIVFFVNFENEIRNSHLSKFKEAKKDIYLKSNEYKSFVNSLDASEDYLEENKEKIYEFFLSGMMSVYNIYNRSLSSTKYRSNLAKITKAELTGKLKDIKFYEGDLSREIGYDVSKEQEEAWKENIKFKGCSYTAEEADDYETIIKLGAIPVSTCMSYAGGSYNYCLLSNFDANKKVLLGKSADGTILGRAILRLTKISDTKGSYVGEDEGLVFRDVENMSESTAEVKKKKEELVLFLERCYTSANNVEDMQFDLVRLAYEKAKKLGVRLMIASTYGYSQKLGSFKTDMQAISKAYIYISKSKNGQQYLDSFSGNTSNDLAGYRSANGYRVYLQENMFNEAFEKKNNN